jgi:catechol 2,3-dioxygenase-like lactoylglutathione lyase family enzyme
MTIAKLAHYSLRTHDLEASRRFYTEILGLRTGFRPPFPFPGLWLYHGDDESEFGVVHLIGTDTASAAALQKHLGGLPNNAHCGTGALDHIAFLATGWQSLRERCERRSIRYVKRAVPVLGLLQVFLSDPSGVTIELNYSADEGTTEIRLDVVDQ